LALLKVVNRQALPGKRPSVLHKALVLIRDGCKKKHELCVVFESFDVGRQLLSAAEVVVERHAGDVVGDGALKQASDLMSTVSVVNLAKCDPELAITMLSEVTPAILKLVSAFTSWSKIRCEEKWSEISSIIRSMVAAVQHFAEMTVKEFVGVLKDLDALHAALGRELDNDNNGNDEAAQEVPIAHMSKAIPLARWL
jgi:hypothetical protein